MLSAQVAAVGSAAVLFSLSGRQSRTCLLLCVGGDGLVCVLSCKRLCPDYFLAESINNHSFQLPLCLLAKYLPCAAVKSCFQRENKLEQKLL